MDSISAFCTNPHKSLQQPWAKKEEEKFMPVIATYLCLSWIKILLSTKEH